MKVSDLPSYTHIELVTAGSTILNYRGLLVTCDVGTPIGPGTITGTTWHKDSGGNYINFTLPIDSTTARDIITVLAFSPRTIASITAGITIYGLR
jgi:hypothetical protein